MWFWQAQLLAVLSPHQYLQRAIKNKQKQILISNQHIWVPRWRAFNFASVPFRCMLGMPSNSGIKTELEKKNKQKKTCKQKVWFLREKKNNLSTTYHDLLNASQLLYPLGYLCCGFCGMLFRVFSTWNFIFNPLQSKVDYRSYLRKRYTDGKCWMLGTWCDDVGSLKASYRCDKKMDRFSAL